jgi:hypothetical protein
VLRRCYNAHVPVASRTRSGLYDDFNITTEQDQKVHQSPSKTRFSEMRMAPSTLLFPNAKGPARLKDAIEEMGALENFLP